MHIYLLAPTDSGPRGGRMALGYFLLLSTAQNTAQNTPRQHHNMPAKTCLLSCLVITNLATALASVAIGLGRLNPGMSSWPVSASLSISLLLMFSEARRVPGPGHWGLSPAGAHLVPPDGVRGGALRRQARHRPHLLLLVSHCKQFNKQY